MPVTMERVGVNMAKLAVTVSPEAFVAAVERVYQKYKARYVVPGFRRGKAPRAFIERLYGADVFREEAARESAWNEFYDYAESTGLRVLAPPEVDIESEAPEEGVSATLTVYLFLDASQINYTGLEFPKREVVVTEDDIDAEIERTRKRNARIISVDDRPAQMGDDVVIDFEGFMYNLAFEGGKAEDFSLRIGSDSLIPGFEEQLCGHVVGDEFEVYVTFPDDYGKGGDAEEFAGKPARFDVRMKSVAYEELPEADDEFAQDVSEFDTFEEYRENVRVELEEQARKREENRKRDYLLGQLVEHTEMDIPPSIVKDQIDYRYRELYDELERRGATIEDFKRDMGLDDEMLLQNYMTQAVRDIKAVWIMDIIADGEGLTASKKEIEEAIESEARSYDVTASELIERRYDGDRENAVSVLLRKKALDLVAEKAVEIDAPEYNNEEEITQITSEGD